MSNNNGILQRGWVIPFMGITMALMAVAMWAMMAGMNKASAGSPSQNAAEVGNMYLLDGSGVGGASDWTTILDGAVDTANDKDVVAIVSLECGLHTRTKVKGKTGEIDNAMASAGVMVRVLVNGEEMEPGEVRYCERTQELEAQFGGVLEQCEDGSIDGIIDGVITSDECIFSDEYIELMLHTINANSFNFIQLNLPSSGNAPHDVQVQAKVYVPADFTNSGDSEAYGFIGKGALIVEEVKYAKAEELSLP